MVPMLLSSCPVWDSCSPASLFAGRPFTPWGSSSQVASRFKQVTHSYGPGSIRDFVILRMPALCSLTSVSDWRSRTGGRWHAAFCPIYSRSAIGSTLRRPSFRRRSDQPTHNTRGRQSASFPGCAEARPRQRAAAVTSARKPKRRIRRTRNCTGCEQIAASFAGGRRTWWAHLEFVRINTTPTILRNQFEDATAPSGHVAGGLAAACVSRNRKSPFRS